MHPISLIEFQKKSGSECTGLCDIRAAFKACTANVKRAVVVTNRTISNRRRPLAVKLACCCLGFRVVAFRAAESSNLTDDGCAHVLKPYQLVGDKLVSRGDFRVVGTSGEDARAAFSILGYQLALCIAAFDETYVVTMSRRNVRTSAESGRGPQVAWGLPTPRETLMVVLSDPPRTPSLRRGLGRVTET